MDTWIRVHWLEPKRDKGKVTDVLLCECFSVDGGTISVTDLSFGLVLKAEYGGKRYLAKIDMSKFFFYCF